MIRAIIFDMGGTLLRFARPGTGTWREFEAPGIRGLYNYLIDQGHPIAAHEDDFVTAMFARLAEGWEQSTGGHINLRAADWIAAGAAEHAITLDEEILQLAARQYAQPLRQGLAAMPAAHATLKLLREQGYRTGLLSNTIWPAELHIEDLAEFDLLPYLEHLSFSGEIGLWKPNPQVFRDMLAHLAIPPDQAIFVGDNPREDIIGAQRVGIRAIWQRNSEFQLGDVQPDAIIDSLEQLPHLLQRWNE